MKKILVVEDEADIRESITDMLGLAEFDVSEATNGEEALALLADTTPLPDLIISDIMMPIMDGYDLFKAVRNRFEMAQIPFIFLTALAGYEEMRAGMDLGADDYLIKPFNYEQLINAIESRLNQKAQANEHRYRQIIHKLIELREKENEGLAERLKELTQKVIGLQLLLNLPRHLDNGEQPDPTDIVSDIKTDLDESIQLLSPVIMFEQLNLIPLISWLLKLYSERGDFEIDFQRSGYTPTFNQKDKLFLFRIFEEILENTVQHSQCQTLTVRLKTVPDRFDISFEDDGIGFDVQKLHEQNQGGLLQMIERVQMLNGEVDIVSAPQAGVKISLSLPMLNNNEQLESHDSAEWQELPDGRSDQKTTSDAAPEIIIAEKQDIVRYGVRELLSQGQLQATILTAKSEEALISQLGKPVPQIILLDLMLKESGGFELIKSLKFQFPNVLLIAFSDKEQEMYAAEALRCGAIGYLLKSASPIEMIEAINSGLRGQKFISSRIQEAVEAHLSGHDWHGYSPIDSLTSREKEIMFMVLDGLISSEISEKLVISKRTVEKHRSNLMNKLGLKSPAELVRFASEAGLTDLGSPFSED